MLILLRHGQTEINAQARLQGRIDLPLDEEGRRQASLSAAHVHVTWPGARIVSSPLQRARETAGAIGEHDIDDRFIELDYGDWDGLALSEVDRVEWSKWRNDPSFRPPAGESLLELDSRVRPALEELVEEARTGHVVVVSHVSPIKSAITWALGIGPDATWRCRLDRASFSMIDIGPNGPALAGMNITVH